MNGCMPLKAFNGAKYLIYGGPYARKPRGMFGIRMAKEINLPAAAVVECKDFGTPDPVQTIAALNKCLDLMIEGHPVYVGCMGGIGRTGTFLALLAKLWQVKGDPIHYVRCNYLVTAVETRDQANFVRAFKFPWQLRMKVIWAKIQGFNSNEETLTSLVGVDIRNVKFPVSCND